MKSRGTAGRSEAKPSEAPSAGPDTAMIILGLGAPSLHDSAAALLVDGKIAATVEEERYSRTLRPGRR